MPKYIDKDGKTVRLKKDGTPDRRKPPEHAQFKKGQSGNQTGRPRKAVSAAEVVQKVLSRKAAVNQGGKTRMVDLDEAMIISAVTNAIKTGNHRAVTGLLSLAEKARAASGPSPEELEQRKVLANRIIEMCERISEPGVALERSGLVDVRGSDIFVARWIYEAHRQRREEGIEDGPFDVDISSFK